jgi:trigger factor
VTFTIHKEEDEQRQLQVTVEVEESRVQKQMDQFVGRLVREAQIPGFRRGKVPRNVILKRFGLEALRAEAVEEMLEPLIVEIFDELGTDDLAFYQPVMEHMDLEPLIIKFTIPLEPVVKLGDYRSFRKELEVIEVTDEALAEAVEHIRAHHQVLEEMDRPAEAGDVVTVTGEGKVTEDETVFWHVHEAEVLLDSEKAFTGLPMVENIIGMSAGESKEFTFTFPEDYDEEELAGKEANVEVTVNKVQSRFLPELDDEMAQKEGDFETAEKLIARLKEDLREHAQDRARAELLDEMVDKMMEDVEIVYPPAAVETELDKMIETMKSELKRAGLEWEKYLEFQNETDEVYREKQREKAETSLRRGLTLRQFVLEEKIKVRTADIDAAMEDRLAKFGDDQELREQLRNIFMQGKSFESMQQVIVEEKIYERMKAIVTGNAPDLASLEEDEAPEEDEEE